MEQIRLTEKEIRAKAESMEELFTFSNQPVYRRAYIMYCKQAVLRKSFEPQTERRLIRALLQVYWKHATVQKTRAADRAMNEKIRRLQRSTKPAIMFPEEGEVRF